ncbi:MAG: metalloregulator ArsR/SmtB family transcription factor [Acidaminobacteraceae bacterium]
MKELINCNCNVIHEDKVKEVQASMEKEEVIMDLADFFKVLGDSTRMKIISILFENELCVCDIAYILKMTQSAISHQLRVLKSARLVKYRKEGKVVFYSLDDDHVKDIFDLGMIHLKHE